MFQSATSARLRLSYPQKTQIEVTKITDWGTCGALQCVPASRSNAIFFAAPVSLASCLLCSLKYDLGNSLFGSKSFLGGLANARQTRHRDGDTGIVVSVYPTYGIEIR